MQTTYFTQVDKFQMVSKENLLTKHASECARLVCLCTEVLHGIVFFTRRISFSKGACILCTCITCTNGESARPVALVKPYLWSRLPCTTKQLTSHRQRETLRATFTRALSSRGLPVPRRWTDRHFYPRAHSYSEMADSDTWSVPVVSYNKNKCQMCNLMSYLDEVPRFPNCFTRTYPIVLIRSIVLQQLTADFKE